jgi:hypothetical protein
MPVSESYMCSLCDLRYVFLLWSVVLFSLFYAYMECVYTLSFIYGFGHDIGQTVSLRLLTDNPRLNHWRYNLRFLVGWSGTKAHFSRSCFSFLLLINSPPLFHTNMWSPPEQAAHYHIFSLEVCGFISDPERDWLQSNEFSFLLCLWFQ